MAYKGQKVQKVMVQPIVSFRSNTCYCRGAQNLIVEPGALVEDTAKHVQLSRALGQTFEFGRHCFATLIIGSVLLFSNCKKVYSFAAKSVSVLICSSAIPKIKIT